MPVASRRHQGAQDVRVRIAPLVAGLGAGLGLLATSLVGAVESEATDHPLLEFAQERQKLRTADDDATAYFVKQLAQVRHELARAQPPADASCAGSIGAPRFAALHVQVGDALRMTGEYENARSAYQRALACRPRDVHILTRIADVWFLLRDFDAARGVIDQALDIEPRNIDLNRLAGNCDFSTGRWADAMARFRYVATSDLNPDSAAFAQLMFWLAQSRAGTPKPEWVTRRLGDHWPRALVLFVKGEYSEAELLRSIRKSEEEEPWAIDGQLLSGLFYAGQTWWARGEPDVARRYFAAAVSLRLAHTDEYRLAMAEIAKLNQP